jgi:hypothetical protein
MQKVNFNTFFQLGRSSIKCAQAAFTAFISQIQQLANQAFANTRQIFSVFIKGAYQKKEAFEARFFKREVTVISPAPEEPIAEEVSAPEITKIKLSSGEAMSENLSSKMSIEEEKPEPVEVNNPTHIPENKAEGNTEHSSFMSSTTTAFLGVGAGVGAAALKFTPYGKAVWAALRTAKVTSHLAALFGGSAVVSRATSTVKFLPKQTATPTGTSTTPSKSTSMAAAPEPAAKPAKPVTADSATEAKQPEERASVDAPQTEKKPAEPATPKATSTPKAKANLSPQAQKPESRRNKEKTKTQVRG